MGRKKAEEKTIKVGMFNVKLIGLDISPIKKRRGQWGDGSRVSITIDAEFNVGVEAMMKELTREEYYAYYYANVAQVLAVAAKESFCLLLEGDNIDEPDLHFNIQPWSVQTEWGDCGSLTKYDEQWSPSRIGLVRVNGNPAGPSTG